MTHDVWHFYQFCPRCGGRLVSRPGESQTELVCVTGDFTFYQNPHGAVGSIIVNSKGEIMLVKRKFEPRRGTWDVPGGFVDWGETPRAAIIRELKEELSVRFTPVGLVGVYHDWYPDQGLLVSVHIMYFYGRISGRTKPKSDVAANRWFSPDRLPDNISFPHINHALRDFRRQQHHEF